MLKRSCFRTSFGSHSVKESQKLLKFARQQFYPTLSPLCDKLNWETSLLVRSEILGLFVNTFITDGKFSRHNMENFPKPIRMQLSKKSSTFSGNFITILEST